MLLFELSDNTDNYDPFGLFNVYCYLKYSNGSMVIN